jgi:hypothetical protein
MTTSFSISSSLLISVRGGLGSLTTCHDIAIFLGADCIISIYVGIVQEQYPESAWLCTPSIETI